MPLPGWVVLLLLRKWIVSTYSVCEVMHRDWIFDCQRSPFNWHSPEMQVVYSDGCGVVNTVLLLLGQKKNCKDGEPWRASSCDQKEIEQPAKSTWCISHKKGWWTDSGQSVDHSKGNCYQAWPFHGNMWVTLLTFFSFRTFAQEGLLACWRV